MTTASIVIAFADLVAIALFIYGLHELNSPATARRGNRLAMIGMFIALVGVVASTEGVGWWAIAVGTAIGAIIGVYAALKVKMTAMPQMVALYNGAGGGAAALISTVEFYVVRGGTIQMDDVIAISLVLSAIIGAISFAGSIVAFLKLQELMTGRPVTYPGQQIVNAIVLLAILGLGGWFVVTLGVLPLWAFGVMMAAALLLGVLFVLPIGGADMPVVISLLNSFTG
ncbi:MAG TPA: NAD(P)(+) transhydrogenase (Re/Si-specific) subunit beta, partial [Candidatus Acidoferrum sp.]|nr:NAD(P)(+) transhydrogenase (Re/Si-specific) subunit beta [Candidatus Acidoferrum sp.]